MFISNDYFLWVVQCSKILAIIFLLYQSITLIDFGYVWNEVWVTKYENGTPFYLVLLILFSILLLCGNVFLNLLNIQEYWIEGCYFNKFSIICSFLMIVIFTSLVLLKLNEESSIMTALYVSLLYTYLSGLALNS